MKRLLFIGDLRTANNYGAIATTETLLKLLDEKHYDIDVKYIDYRSLYHPTPVTGFKPHRGRTVKQVVAAYLPDRIKKIIKSFIKPANDFVPYKYSQYEEYYQKMVLGSGLQFEKKMLEWADIVYINGEGNIVNGTDQYGKYRMGARYILFMAWLSKTKYNRPTLIVNHTVDPNNYNAFEMISRIYPFLDKIYVRETLSLALLQQHGIQNCSFVPDALWAYKPKERWTASRMLEKEIDFSKPYICLGDSSGIRNAYGQVKWDIQQVLGEVIDKLREIVPQVIFVDGFDGNNKDINNLVRKKRVGRVNLHNCTYHDLFYVLKGASLFISGRWHASILSTLANTPILLWGSDSHKTKSLYTLLDYKYRFFEVSTLPVNIDDLVESAREVIRDSSQIKAAMSSDSNKYARLANENVNVLEEYVR